MNILRDRAGNLWTVSRFDGRYVAICNYVGKIAGSFSGRTYAEVKASVEAANASQRRG